MRIAYGGGGGLVGVNTGMNVFVRVRNLQKAAKKQGKINLYLQTMVNFHGFMN